MSEVKEAKRWRFVLSGNVTVAPMQDEDGNVACMVVETDIAVTRCYSPQEVNDAIDIAMHHAQFTQYAGLH